MLGPSEALDHRVSAIAMSMHVKKSMMNSTTMTLLCERDRMVLPSHASLL